MAETPSKKSKQTPQQKQRHFSPPNPTSTPIPATPNTLDPTPVRRSSRLHSISTTTLSQKLPLSSPAFLPSPPCRPSRRKSLKFTAAKCPKNVEKPPDAIPPISPDRVENRRKRKLSEEIKVGLDKKRGPKGVKKRVYYRKVKYDGGEFSVGADVYVKRREDVSSDTEDPEVEECVMCFKVGRAVMIECDECLVGFHLKCLKPPLMEVPEGEWICGFCEAKKMGKDIQLPVPPNGKKRARTAREKLLSSDLWAARIESIWKEVDGVYWFRAHWYIIPEETASGRQPHNLRRELYRTNDFAEVEMESVIRHCYVMDPKEYSKASNEGDDVYLCEYEYDIKWHSFKRIAEVGNNKEKDGEGDASDKDWSSYERSDSDSEDDIEYEEKRKRSLTGPSTGHLLAANTRKGCIVGLQRIGVKKIPEHVRCHKQTELEKAKATLLLASLPKSPPCRTKLFTICHSWLIPLLSISIDDSPLLKGLLVMINALEDVFIFMVSLELARQ